MFRRKPPSDEAPKPRPDRSWPTRIAWGVLGGVFLLVVTRASVATVVRVHGDGMAPTILDGDAVLLLRSTRSLEAGDIVVYDPTPMPEMVDAATEAPLPGEAGESGLADPARDPGSSLVNTAVVDVEEVERRFERMKGPAAEGPTAPPAAYRLGRVIAVPGDAVTFNVPDAAMGLAINGVPMHQEPAPPRRSPTATGDHEMRAAAFEVAGETRFEVLEATQTIHWEGMELPIDDSPVQIRAEGYLIVADNRDESRCCDSRALGWIHPERVRGEIAARIASKPPTTRDGEDARRIQWLP